MKNYGYIEPTILKEDYLLGGIAGISKKEVLCPDRDWTESLPPGEIQRRTIETSSCTDYATYGAAETLIYRKYGIEEDFSERYAAIGAGNSPRGNDPNKVAQWIRKNGAVDEGVLPFTDKIQSWEEYMRPDPLPRSMKRKGKRWGYDFKHEWVFTGTADTEKMWEALQYSPLGVSVYAWFKQEDYYIKPRGYVDNHWTLVIGGIYEETWRIFDSYIDDDYFKEVPWDYPFSFCKWYSIEKEERGWLSELFNCV